MPAHQQTREKIDALSIEASRSTTQTSATDGFALRVQGMYGLYLRSERRWRFPLISLFSFAWLDRLATLQRRARWLTPASWSRFMERLCEVNRSVYEGLREGFEGRREAPFDASSALAAVEDEDSARQLFSDTLRWEQGEIVTPCLNAATASLDAPLLRALVKHSALRMAYFKPWQIILFSNFLDERERLLKSERCYEIARRRGWEQVEASARDLIAHRYTKRRAAARPR